MEEAANITPDTFVVRVGSVDAGRDYEELLIASTLLELIFDDKVQDFKVSSNEEGMGSFDDLVVRVQYKDASTKQEAIQIKHFENQYKSLKYADLEGSNKAFNIGKYYYDTINSVKGDWTYILHTNRKLEEENRTLKLRYIIKDNKEKTGEIKIHANLEEVETGDEPGKIYKFNLLNEGTSDNENNCKDFFSRFVLKTEQYNIKKLYSTFLNKFQKRLGGSEDDFIIFMEFVKRWKRKKFKERLSKAIVVLKIVESLLSASIRTIEFTDHVKEPNFILQQIILKFDITVFKTSNKLIHKIWVNTKSNVDINKAGFKNFLLTEDIENIFDENAKAHKSTLISWYLEQCPLIIEVTENIRRVVLTAIDLLSRCEETRTKKLVLLQCNDIKADRVLRNLFDLRNMDGKCYETILQQFPLSFQGRSCKLKDIVISDDIAKTITTDCLVAMANDEFCIGAKEELTELHVPRKLSRIIIDFNYVNDVNSCSSILIRCTLNEERELQSRFKEEQIIDTNKLIDMLKRGQSEEKIIWLSSSDTLLEEIVLMMNNIPEKNYHHFKYSDANLEWIESKGNMKELQEYRLNSLTYLHELKIFGDYNKINILCAELGLGTTTTLKYFKNSCDTKYWPLYLRCRDHVSQINGKLDLKTLASNSLNTFEIDLLNIFYKEGKVVLLWDALDEVQETQERKAFYKAIKNIHITQWITSGPHIKEELEDEFNAFARTIEIFSNDQREKYVERRLAKQHDRRNISTIYSKINRNFESLEAQCILGNPTQLLHLTELLCQNSYTSDDLSSRLVPTALYQNFLNAMLELHFQKINVKDSYIKDELKKTYFKTYKERAINCLELTKTDFSLALYENSSMRALGPIITLSEKNLHFIHPTYMEYFAALSLCDKRPTVESLRQIYFDKKFKNVAFMMDLIISEGCPAHIAVLYKDLNALEKNKKYILEEDSARRTSIHLALSRVKQFVYDLKGSESQQQLYLQDFEIICHIMKYLYRIDKESFEFYDKIDKLIDFDYSQCLLHVAVMTKDLYLIRLIVQKSKPPVGVDSRNNEGETPLMYAVSVGNLEIVQYLVEVGANVNAATKYGWTPIWFAVNGGYIQILECLVQKGAQITAAEYNGTSILSGDILKNNQTVSQFIMNMTERINIFNLEETKQEFKEDQISRSLTRIMMDNKLMVNLKADDILVISCCSQNVETLGVKMTRLYRTEDLLEDIIINEDIDIKTDNIYALTNKCTANQFFEIAKHFLRLDKKCHHLKYYNNSLEWVESTGKVENLKLYQLKEKPCYDAQTMFREENSSLNVICAHPGTGKTTILKAFKDEPVQGHRIFYFNLLEHVGNMETMKIGNFNYITLQKFLIKTLKVNKQFEKDLLEILVKERRITFLWDDLDGEVLDDNLRTTIYSFINETRKLGFVQWIASSYHLKSEIERQLGVLTRNIAKLTRSEQHDYIRIRLSGKIKGNNLEGATKTIIKNMQLIKHHSTFGTPTLLYMYTEMVVKHTEIDEILSLTVTKFYAQYLNETLKYCLKEKKIGEFLEDERYKEEQIKVYELLGMKMCLENIVANSVFGKTELALIKKAETELDPPGFITVSNARPLFIHYTFAEYFAALYLSKNHEKVENLKNIYFKEDFKLIRFLLDLILCENNPAHTAILYKSLYNLKKNKKDMLTRDSGGRTAVHIALAGVKKKFVLPVIDKLKCTTSPKYISRSLDIAIYVLKHLNKSKVESFNIKDKLLNMNFLEYAQGCLPHVAVMSKDMTIIEYVVQKCASVPGKSIQEMYTPLMHAAFIGESRIVKYLIQAYQNVNSFDTSGHTALHFAIYGSSDNREIIEVLLDHGANVNFKNVLNCNVLHMAVRNCGSCATFTFLVENKAEIDCADAYGRTPLMYALDEGRLGIAKCLLHNGANVNISDANGVTALHIATKNNQIEIAKFLIQENAEVNSLDKSGWTPLMYIVERGSVEVMKWLVDNTTEINSPDINGANEFLIAVVNNCVKEFELLAENNAETSLMRDTTTRTLLLSTKNIYIDVFKQFAASNANVNSSDKCGSSSLRHKDKIESQEIMKCQLGSPFEVSVSNSDRGSVLLLAALNSHSTVVKLLIQCEADQHRWDKTDALLLEIMRDTGNELVQLLDESNSNINYFDRMSEMKTDFEEIGKWLLHSKVERKLFDLLLTSKKIHSEGFKLLIVNTADVNHFDSKLANLGRLTPLHIAVRYNLLEVVEHLIQNNAEVNYCDVDKATPLYYAAQAGDLKIVKLLINNKADVNLAKHDGSTALHIAAYEDHVEVAKLLIENKAEINCCDIYKRTPLFCAAEKGNLQTVKCLIDNKAIVNLPSDNGSTALIPAVKQNLFEMVKLLVVNRAEVNCCDVYERTPLYYAAQNGCLEAAEYLIENNALKDRSGEAALRIGAAHNEVEVVKLLVENQVKIDSTDVHGRSALMIASGNESIDTVKFLISKGANCMLTTSIGDTAYHIAIYSEHFDNAELLFGMYALSNDLATIDNNVLELQEQAVLQDDLEKINDFIHKIGNANARDIILHLAVWHNKIEILKFLINKKADINSTGNNNWTPLMYAALKGHLEIAQTLIAKNVLVNATNKSGATALHIAIWNSQSKIARLLVEAKIETICFGVFGLSPAMIAVQRNNEDIATYLIDSGLEINGTDSFGFTPLIWAVRKGYLLMAKNLISKGADVNACNSKGYTALNFAILRNRFEVVKVLVENGADINVTHKEAWPFLHYAVARQLFDIAKYFLAKGADTNIPVADGRTFRLQQFEIESGDTPLHTAVMAKSISMVKLLVQNGADAHIKNKKEETPLDLPHVTEEIATYLKSSVQ